MAHCVLFSIVSPGTSGFDLCVDCSPSKFPCDLTAFLTLLQLNAWFEDIRVQLVGVVLASLSCGFGEINFLALCTFYPKNVVAGFVSFSFSFFSITVTSYPSPCLTQLELRDWWCRSLWGALVLSPEHMAETPLQNHHARHVAASVAHGLPSAFSFPTPPSHFILSPLFT